MSHSCSLKPHLSKKFVRLLLLHFSLSYKVSGTNLALIKFPIYKYSTDKAWQNYLYKSWHFCLKYRSTPTQRFLPKIRTLYLYTLLKFKLLLSSISKLGQLWVSISKVIIIKSYNANKNDRITYIWINIFSQDPRTKAHFLGSKCSICIYSEKCYKQIYIYIYIYIYILYFLCVNF